MSHHTLLQSLILFARLCDCVWSGTCELDQAGLKLPDLPLSVSQMLGLWASILLKFNLISCSEVVLGELKHCPKIVVNPYLPWDLDLGSC